MEREAETARSRASLYSLLACMVSREPDEAFLRELNAPSFRDAGEALGLSPPPMPAPEVPEASYQDLSAEFARLFLIPGTPLHPYESVQRGEDRLWGEFTVKVQRAYDDTGFTINPETNQAPDHLAVELEFVSHLANREADRWEGGSAEDAEALNKLQKNFLEEHLGAWAIPFARSVMKETSNSYFRFLAEMLETVVESDLSLFNVSQDEP